MKAKEAVMLWKSDATWLQTVDERGQLRLSFCGRLSQSSVEAFCRSHGIGFAIVRERPQASEAKPAGA